MAKKIMVQSTGSHAVEGVIVAAFYRLFLQDGYEVAPSHRKIWRSIHMAF